MILPPRPENHPRPEPPRRALDLAPRQSTRTHAGTVPHSIASPRLPGIVSPPNGSQIEDSLPADHLARAIDEAVDQLDLTAFFASYLGVGSKAHRPDLFLKIVLYEIQTGRHSPDQWAQDVRDRRCLQWLGLGITPSRTRCYAFRDRVGPLLETLNRQVLGSAVVQGLTTARRGSLDGTLIAANASRHRLVNLSRLERRLAELDRVIAADKTGQDPGAIPAWMARSPATRRRQRYRFARGPAEVVEATRPERPPQSRQAARAREDRHQYQRFRGRLGPGQGEGLPAAV